MRFGILGPLEVSVADHGVGVAGRRRRALLVRLLMSANSVVSAQRLLEDVWEDSQRPRVVSTLSSHVLMLRRVVGQDRVLTHDTGYLVRVEPGELDLSEFETDVALGRRAVERGDARAAVASFGRALDRWRGPALFDVIGMGWADQEAARVEALRQTTTESLLEARLVLGQHHDVCAAALTAVGDEPLRERRWAALMLASYRCGRQADALRAYQRVRRALGSELGINPSPGLAGLDAAILRHDPLLDTVTVEDIFRAAWPSSNLASKQRGALIGTASTTTDHAAPASSRPLPAPRDALIGRERELVELPALLGATRLVTLTGIGGIGKTRLAVETAHRTAARFDTTAFVDLSASSEPVQVVSAAVTALELPMPPGVAPIEALIGHLRDGRALLVIDNAEHLVDAVAELVEAILDKCPACQVLVTSRQPMHVRGERIWPVAPLDPSTTAVQLFHERLGGPTDHGQTVELCRRLDGIPLAIELAAATCRTLGVHHLVERLDERFDLLLERHPARGRHATLRATLEWSHDLLTVAERQLLRRLTVFAGTFGLPAVEAICGPLDSAAPTAAVLASLADKSLVVFDHEHGRYRLLESVRLFGAERLHDAREHAAYREAHARWYLHGLLAQPSVDVTTLHPHIADAPNLLAAADWWTLQDRHRDIVVLLSRSAGLWIELMQEATIAARALASYERCRDQLTNDEDAIACALFGIALRPGRPWRQRGVQLDPNLTCRPARSNPVALALADADQHPTTTIETIAALRALPGGLDPDISMLACVAEAQARCRLDDIDGAEAVYSGLIDDRSSMFWCGPMLALAAIRTVRSDTAGAQQLLDLVDQHPHHHLRLGPITNQAVRIQLDIAKGNLDAAADGLRRLEALHGQYDTNHRSLDHLWFETAAYLAAARGDLDAAAHLAHGAERTLGDGESSPFITWALRRRHRHEPAWRTAIEHPITLDETRRLARAITNNTPSPTRTSPRRASEPLPEDAP